MSGEVLVHLEHGHLVLAEDLRELAVREDLAAVLRVLQVVRADVLPDFAHHLAPGEGVRAQPPQPVPPMVVAASAAHSVCLRWPCSLMFWSASISSTVPARRTTCRHASA